MPRYYFHVLGEAGDLIPDVVGKELAHATAARVFAAAAVSTMVRESAKLGRRQVGEAIVIQDHTGKLVATVAIEDDGVG